MELSPLVAELERLYVEAVYKWWGLGDAPTIMLENRPAITIASRGRKSTVNGWYVPAVWSDTVDSVLDFLAGDDKAVVVKSAEIVIASEVLSDPVQAIAELVRQMLAHGDPNLRPKEGSFYYGGRWSSIAASVDCVAAVNPEQPSKGLSLWIPGAAFKQWATETWNPVVWSVSRDSLAGVKKGSRMKKWSCGCTIVRCATKLDSTCHKCGKLFKWAEVEPNPYLEVTA